MKRLRTENINTPEHFDQEWSDALSYRWDFVRMRALVSHAKNSDRVIDVGCGLFGACEYIACCTHLMCELHCIDFSEKAAAHFTMNYPRIHFKVGRIEKMDYPDDLFDCVFCGEVIEHMEDPAGFIKELIRICKPGGWVTLSTVNTNCINAKKLTYPEHIWEFTPEDLTGFFGKGSVYKLVGDYHFIDYQK